MCRRRIWEGETEGDGIGEVEGIKNSLRFRNRLQSYLWDGVRNRKR